MTDDDLLKKIRIKDVSELPNWFCLEKYDNTKTLNAAGWYEQLFVRYNLFEALKRLEEYTEDDDYDIEAAIDLVDHTFFKIEKNPIIDVSTDQKLSEEFLIKVLQDLKQKKCDYMLGIHNITINEFLSIESAANPRLKVIKKYWKKHALKDDYNTTQLDNLLDKPLYKLYYPQRQTLHEAAIIDWELPDKILLDHFKQFLKLNRPKKLKYEMDYDTGDTFLKKSYRKPNFKQWYRLSILPYLDLKFWSIENNITIPYRVFADAIFKPGENGEETIRKTTAPYSIHRINTITLC
jgi:hypothetical protein